jgi:hypothetical protein
MTAYRLFGFSTGSVALNDVRRGLAIASHLGTNAVERSALREDELGAIHGLLRQVHMSFVNFQYRHERLNFAEITNTKAVFALIKNPVGHGIAALATTAWIGKGESE